MSLRVDLEMPLRISIRMLAFLLPAAASTVKKSACLLHLATLVIGQMPVSASLAVSADPDWCAALTRTQDPDGLINVRSGPGIAYNIVAESPSRVMFWVDQNSAVRDNSTGLIWFEGYATSREDSGFAGWIRSDFLDLTECTVS